MSIKIDRHDNNHLVGFDIVFNKLGIAKKFVTKRLENGYCD